VFSGFLPNCVWWGACDFGVCAAVVVSGVVVYTLPVVVPSSAGCTIRRWVPALGLPGILICSQFSIVERRTEGGSVAFGDHHETSSAALRSCVFFGRAAVRDQFVAFSILIVYVCGLRQGGCLYAVLSAPTILH